MTFRVLSGLLLLSGSMFGASREFEQIVKAIESHYGTTQTHIPMMGLANFVVRTAHPEGVHDFKIAVFHDLDAERGDSSGLNSFMGALQLREMHPLVQVHSGVGEQSTYIYAGEPGKATRLLVATFGRDQATVVEVKVEFDRLVKLMQHPDRISENLGVGKDEPDSEP